jgi:transposase
MIEIEGMTRKQVAKELGISKDTLKRRMDKLGIKIEKPEKIIPDRPHREHKLKVLRRYLGHYDLTKEEENLKFLDVIKKEDVEKALLDNNYSIPKTAEDLWISTSLLDIAIRKYKINIDHGPRISDYSEEFYRKAYVEDGLTYVEVAEIVGLSTDTVRKYLKRTFPDAGKLGKYQSIGELLVAKALESLGIKFKYNVRYKGYNKKDPNRLYIIDFEFFYNGKKYWIEYNGKQHYEFVEYFYKTEENFKERLERDRFVSEELTKLVGTNLIIIRYDTESIENDIKVSLGIQ